MSRFGFILVLLIVLGLTVQCTRYRDFKDPLNEKVKGLVFTGPANGPLKDHMISSMKSVESNFVAFVPEGTVFRQNLKISIDFENQWFGEKTLASLQGIGLARQNGLKVMLKPHLSVGWDLSDWKRPEIDFDDTATIVNYRRSLNDYLSDQSSKAEGGNWRGEFMVKEENDWFKFEEAYEAFILNFAVLADSLDVEIFCIGTELKRTALEKPDFWRRLIKKVRKVYKGAITYAANWDSYDKIEFWDELDYIGVNAYFPLSTSSSPTVKEMVDSWVRLKKSIKATSDKFKRPVLFTEWGYENEDFVGKEPWVMGRPSGGGNSSNFEAQSNAYEATFKALSNEKWMKGFFVWRWSPTSEANKVINYSPQDKPAEKVLLKWFRAMGDY